MRTPPKWKSKLSNQWSVAVEIHPQRFNLRSRMLDLTDHWPLLLMRRKAIIVLAITFMVTVMVTAFSYLYISQILRQRINSTYEERRPPDPATRLLRRK